jgi:MoaA/NifB/PqqE/SkfB family radical SAM enzyme
MQSSGVGYEPGGRGTPLDVMRRLFSQTSLDLLGITGGEPILSPFFGEILSYVHTEVAIPVILATNGSLLDPDVIRSCLKNGVVNFQIPLLSDCEKTHNLLVGGPAWGKVIESFAAIRSSGGYVTPVFIATRKNLGDLVGVLEIAALFGMRGILFNEFIFHPESAQRSYADLAIDDDSLIKDSLRQADSVACRHNIRIFLGTPIPVTASEQGLWRSIEPCSCGTSQSRRSFVLDARGYVRRCLLSHSVLGNIMTGDLESILKSVPTDYSSPLLEGGITLCHLANPLPSREVT